MASQQTRGVNDCARGSFARRWAAQVPEVGMAKHSELPPGWDEERAKRVLKHYESQSKEEAVAEAEAEAAQDSPVATVMNVPTDLVSEARELIARHKAGDLDEETVVETIAEIAASGDFARDSEGLLFRELNAFGYSAREWVHIVKFCRTISGIGEPRTIARALYGLLIDRKSLLDFIKAGTLAAACLMNVR
jgi:hypothetical protein